MKKKFLHIAFNNIAIGLLLLAPVLSQGQNINRTNKLGPMNLEVNTLTGNLLIPRTDFTIPSRIFNIDIRFYYNSFNYMEDVGFGNGWGFKYHIKYRNDSTGKTIIWGDGREDNYILEGSSYKAPRGFFNVLSEYATGKFSLTELDGTKFLFDNHSHRRITKLEEPNGNFLSFQYSDTLLTSITSQSGQTITLSYDNGRLTTITEAIATPARSFTYAYDAAGNLTTVTDPLNGTNKYSYLVNGPMKKAEDKNHNVVDIIYYNDLIVSELIGCNKRISFSYDSTTATTFVTDHLTSGTNQVTKYQYKKINDHQWLSSISGNCCGFNMQFEFDAEGNKIKETDANGNITSFTYDSKGNIITVKDALDQTESYTYSNDFNRPKSYTDAKGNITTMSYDSKGNLTQLVEPGNLTYTATYNAAGEILTSTDPKGNAFTYNYDSHGNPVSVSGPNGFSSTLGYNARGHLLSFTDPRNNSSVLEYDILGRLKKIADPLNHDINVSYDAAGNPVAIINQNNEQSVLGFDASDRLASYTDATGKKSFFAYDGMDNIKSITNALGNTFKFNYDNKNRLSSAIDALGNTTNLGYDDNGNMKIFTLPNGQSINYNYDALNRVTSASDNNGTLGSVTYDKNDNITSFVNETGNATTAEYDNLDRIVKITDALGNAVNVSYDNNGNIASITDRNGNTSSYTYDENDRVKTFTRNGAVITISYDAAGNFTQLRDQNNNITTYTYDELDRTKRVTYPDGRYLEFTYDDKGNKTAKRLTDGTTITYQYDSLNRLITKTLGDGQVFSFSYDALSRVSSATNNAGTVIFTYDALNRVTSETFDGRKVNYAYSTAGRTQTTIYPDSTIITNVYDTRNRVVRILKNNVPLVNYEYNNAGQVIKKTFGNGVVTNYQYDFANRLSNLSTSNGELQNSVFEYDKERNKTSINRLFNTNLSEQFVYDSRNRLTQYKRGAIGGSPVLQNTYSYDAVGNRTTANLTGVNTSYTSNNLNQLTNVNGAGLTYDNNGNRTFDGVYHKQYDAEGRLLKDSASPANVISYHYDALGRRVIKSINGLPSKYTYSGIAPIEERDGITNSILNRTMFSYYMLPVANDKINQTFYYHQNELASVEAITNASGSLTERYVYDAYGKPTLYNSAGNVISSSIAGNRFMFTGQEYDSATASYRFFFRNYSPSTGTFDQRDLVGYEDGMGMYQYVHNNPANGIDIWGLKDCDEEEKTLLDKVETVNSWTNGGTSWLELVTTWKYKQQLDLLKNYEQYLNGVNKTLINQGLWKQAGNVSETLGKISKRVDALEATKMGKWANGLGKVNMGLNLVDVGIKTSKFGDALGGYSAGTVDGYQLTKAGGNLAQSGLGLTPVGGLYNLFDFTQEKVTSALTGGNGQSMNDNAEYAGQFYGDGSIKLESWMKKTVRQNTGLDLGDQSDEAFDDWQWQQGNAAKWQRAKRSMEEKQRRRNNPDCPQNDPGGTQKPKPQNPGTTKTTEVISSNDPNEIIGPDGTGPNKFVSVKDRLPYTITYENDKSATAPAKFVKITTPIQPKMDASSFRLGSFGFNNLTFTIPDGTSSYYQRLDARDSLGLYVDVTAGYDQLNNQAFWEFQSIDPVTLLPPADPLKGFLLLQDSADQTFGHGFVNFSIKPVSSAITGDTISAVASIIFDQNAVIPTNRHKNTIDAFAPTSSITGLPATSPDTEVILHLAGTDDAGGSGLKSYAIYVSDNNGNPELYAANFSGTDTTFRGLAEHLYKFYVAATDNVGNIEELHLAGTIRISDGEEVICPGGNTTFESSISGTSYQWQVNNGTGFTDIADGGVYSGTTTAALSLNATPTSFYGYQYRCVVNGTSISDTRVIKFAMTWEGTVSTAWENPANWSCNSLPDMNTDVIINGSKDHYPQVNSNAVVRTLKTNQGSSVIVKSGYTLTVIK